VLCQKNIGWNIYGSSSKFFGTMTHANVLSECMVFAFPLTVFGAIIGRKVARILCCAGLISSFFLIVTLKTRAIWVGFIIASIFVFLLLLKNNYIKPLLNKMKLYKISLLSIMTVMLILTIGYIYHDIKDFSDHLRTLANLDSSGRTIIWAKTIQIIHNHFWFGIGLGNFRFYLSKTFGAFFQRPHNDYLWILSETGILGLLAFLSICFFVLKKIFKNTKLLSGEKLFINYCVLFGFIAYLVDSFFAFPKERPYNLVFLAFFMAIPYSTSPKKPMTSLNFKLTAIGMAIIASFFLVFNCFRYDGERILKAVVSNKDPTLKERIEIIRSIKPWAYKADPFSIPVKYYEGMALLGIGNVHDAKECFSQAYTTYPFQPDVLLNLGTACEVTGERNKAKQLYKEAIQADWSDVRPKINLAVVEYKDGEWEQSAGIIRSIDTNAVKKEPQSLVQYNTLKNSLRKFLQP
jgi:tetratricopeptide (TPR) repeat protein